MRCNIIEGQDRPEIFHELPKPYDTGWINRSDWTNVHLGSDTTKNADSNVNHKLGVNLARLVVRVLISTDGTEANSFDVIGGLNITSTGANLGFNLYYVDDDNIIVQTGGDGVGQITTTGGATIIDTEDWYYKIKVYRI